MCRHLARLGPPVPLAAVVAEPPHGLVEQSWAPRLQRHGTVNADGFGLGWFPPGDPEPARYRRSVPIWADANLPELARAVRAEAVLAAVRDATPGTSQDEAAAAPFRAGSWLFSHNGAVPDWQRLPDDLGERLPAAELLGLEARCDSALLLLLIARRLHAGDPPERAVAGVVRQVAAARPGARLNLLLTDGRTLLAVRRGDTLWLRERPGEVLAASEPDGPLPPPDGSGWREVPDDSVVVATRDETRITALHSPAPSRERTR